MNGNKLSATGVSTLCNTLKEHKSTLSTLVLTSNAIGDGCMKDIGEFVKDNNHLTKLYLNECGITDKGVETLSKYIDRGTTLSMLALHENKGITDKSISILQSLSDSSRLVDISIQSTSITKENCLVSSLACNGIRNGSENLDLRKW